MDDHDVRATLPARLPGGLREPGEGVQDVVHGLDNQEPWLALQRHKAFEAKYFGAVQRQE